MTLLACFECQSFWDDDEWADGLLAGHGTCPRCGADDPIEMDRIHACSRCDGQGYGGDAS